jgi:hypothetical protein
MFFPEIHVGWAALLFPLPLRMLKTKLKEEEVKRHRLADGPIQMPARRATPWEQVLECSMPGIRTWFRS